MTTPSAVAVRGRERLLSSTRSKVTLMIVWGVVVSVAGCWHWNSSLQGKQLTLMQSRTAGIAAATQTLDAGGPPLLSTTGPYTAGTAAPGQRLEPVPVGDDPGTYLYLPLIGHWSGINDPTVMLRWFFIGCIGVLLLVYPLIFFAIFDSVAAGLAAPLLLLWKFTFLENSDIYWMGAWAALLCIPALIALYRRPWTGRSVAFAAAIMVAASFASSVRAQAGLGVAIAGLGLALVRERTWRRRGVTVAVLALAYLSIRPIAFYAVTSYRDHEVAGYIRAHPEFNAKSGAHPFWHPAYLGLGYERNPWNIHYNDADALAAAHAEAPEVDETALFLSPRYGSILRRLYFRHWSQRPTLALREYRDKLAVTWDDTHRYFRYSLLLAVPMLAFGAGARGRRRWMLLLVPTLLIALIPPVMTITYFVYELALIAAVGVIWLLLAGWLLSLLESAARSRPKPPSRRPSRPSAAELFGGMPVREANRVLRSYAASLASWLRARLRPICGAIVLTAVAVGCSAAAASIAPGARERSAYWQTSTPLSKRTDLVGHPFTTWRPAKPGLAGWNGNVRFAAADGAATVTTSDAPWAYALTTPQLELPPGHYTFALSGRVARGGVGVGALATSSGTWLAAPSEFSDVQKPRASQMMTTAFTLQSPTGVQLVLFNWALYRHPSVWRLGRAVLYRQSLEQYEGAYYTAQGARAASPAAPEGPQLSAWTFTSGVPDSWTNTGAAVHVRPKSLAVTTTSSPLAIQFESSSMKLVPGTYAIVVDGTVERGGMSIGPVDPATSSWLSVSNFAAGPRANGHFLTSTFVVKQSRTVSLAIANWAPDNLASHWSIRSVEVKRVG